MQFEPVAVFTLNSSPHPLNAANHQSTTFAITSSPPYYIILITIIMAGGESTEQCGQTRFYKVNERTTFVCGGAGMSAANESVSVYTIVIMYCCSPKSLLVFALCKHIVHNYHTKREKIVWKNISLGETVSIRRKKKGYRITNVILSFWNVRGIFFILRFCFYTL